MSVFVPGRLRALPAIDLREGACVQLVGGEYDAERVRLTDVPAVARRWRDAGLAAMHVVDLDAALGRGSNRGVIEQLAREPGVRLQVGGGVRDEDSIARLFELGVERAVVGTRAIEDAAWLERAAARWPQRLVVAADVRGRQVVTRGWKGDGGTSIVQLLERLAPVPLAGVLVTAVHVEGQLAGIDAPLFAEIVTATRHPLIASGGVTTVEDLRVLARQGVAAAVIGMALYTGRLPESALVPEFAP
ncbi:MAG: HisA/HisF-related TIM barrel protein [Myxococcota bacterium]